MSVVGTGIAAGVSQAGLQAQQVAREVDRKKAQNSEDARRVRERFEAHLQTLEDLDQVESVDPVRIYGQAPQDQPQPHVLEDRSELPTDTLDQSVQQPVAQPPPANSSQDDGDAPLYHHLDVKG